MPSVNIHSNIYLTRKIVHIIAIRSNATVLESIMDGRVRRIVECEMGKSSKASEKEEGRRT